MHDGLPRLIFAYPATLKCAETIVSLFNEVAIVFKLAINAYPTPAVLAGIFYFP
jgi:hypothetical protein